MNKLSIICSLVEKGMSCSIISTLLTLILTFLQSRPNKRNCFIYCYPEVGVNDGSSAKYAV